MKLKILTLPLISIVINLLKFIWVPIIIGLRDKSREVVYNYWLQHNLAYRLPNEISKTNLLLDNKIVDVYACNKFVLKYQKVTKWKYYFYLITVYIWLDDTLSADFISDSLAIEILESNYLTNKYHKEINRACKLGKGDSFTNFNSNDRNNLDISIGLLYVTLLYNTNNNFKNIFYYSKDKCTFLNIGYKKEVKVNDINMYKWSI